MTNRDPGAGPRPLTSLQAGMLFHAVYAHDPGMDLTQCVALVEGEVDVPALRSAWASAVDAFDALRTVIRWEDVDVPVQQVLAAAEIEVEVRDWRAVPAGRQDAELDDWLAADRRRGFDLRVAPHCRVTLLRLDTTRYHQVWTQHHITTDGWSNTTVLRHVLDAYERIVAGRQPAAFTGPQFDAYLNWYRGRDRAPANRYLADQLRGLTESTRFPYLPATTGTGYGTLVSAVPPGLYARIRDFGRAHRIATSALVHGAWARVLGRYADTDDVVFGTTLAGRPAGVPGIGSVVGPCLNTVPVRIRCPGATPVTEWLRDIQSRVLGVSEYANAALSEVQALSDIPGNLPLFEALLVFESRPRVRRAPGAGGALGYTPVRTLEQTGYPVTLVVAAQRTMEITVQYDRARLDDAGARRLAGQFQAVLAAVVGGAVRVSDVDIFPEEERAELLRAAGEPARPAGACVHRLVERQVARTPDALALDAGAERLLYSELNVRANRLAHWLRSAGAAPGELVAVCLPRGVDLVVALLGVLKSGAAYVPLDPEFPPPRLEFVLADTAARVLLSDRATADRLAAEIGPALPERVLVLNDDGARRELAGMPASNPDPLAGPESLAYVIYTSGSTGQPKGVMVEHRTLSNFLDWCVTGYSARGRGGAPLFSSVAFDMIVPNLYTPLLKGEVLRLLPADLEVTTELGPALRDRGPFSFIKMTPGHFALVVQQLGAAGTAALAPVLVVGADAFPTKLLAEWNAEVRDTVLLNEYGPTEATVANSTYRIDGPVAGELVPIGRPIPNTTMYSVGRDGDLMPFGVPGELCIGGACVALGYLNRPDLTAERFVPDPFAGGTLYRTGDLGLSRPDGNLEFLGRADDQIKIRGYRVEPAEIEATLNRHPAVRDSVVGTWLTTAGERRLAGYVVRAEGADRHSAESLREFLGARLPEYLVPTAFMEIDAVPLDPNGKVDRKSLPGIGQDRLSAGSGYAPPRDDRERVLAEVWAAVLGVDRVGVHDNFFDLGGDSIQVLQVVSRARRAGLAVSARSVFDRQSVAAVAADAADHAGTNAEQGMVTGDVPLTPIQREFFADGVDRLHRNVLVRLLELPGTVEPSVLTEALTELVRRHDALRLRFVPDERGLLQRHDPDLVVRPVDVVECGTADVDGFVFDLVDTRADLIDLAAGPLLDAVLVVQPVTGRHLLLVLVHHLVGDGVSWRVLVEDLATAYRALAAGERPALGRKTTSFGEWARRLVDHAASERVLAELDHWAQDGVAAPGPFAVGDRPAPSGRTDQLVEALPAVESTRLVRDVPLAHGARLNEVLLAAVFVAVSRITGRDAFTIDVEGHGREDLFPDVDLSRTVGWFTSVFPVALAAPPDDVRVAVAAVSDALRRVPNNGVGYGLLEYLAGDAVGRRRLRPRGQVLFNYLGRFDVAGAAIAPFRVVPVPAAAPRFDGVRRYPLEVDCQVVGGRFETVWTYSATVLDEDVVRSIAEEFTGVLRAALADIEPVPTGERVLPLSPIQSGLLFHSLYAPADRLYWAQLRFELHEEIDPEAMRAAWLVATGRHATPRTRFRRDDSGQLRQVVRVGDRVDYGYRDLAALSPADRRAEVDRMMAEPAAEDALWTAGAVRVVLVRRERARFDVLVRFHHALLDGWSTRLLLHEVGLAYRQCCRGEPVDLPPSPPFEDFLHWLATRRRDERDRFWRQVLDGFHTPTLIAGPADGDEPAGADVVTLRFPAGTTGRVQRFARTHRLTLNTVVQGTWAVLLAERTGHDDVLFGMVVSGRDIDLPGADRIVGPLVNTLPVRISVDRRRRVAEWLAGVQRLLVDLRQFEQTPLVELARLTRLAPGTPLFDSLVGFDNFPDFDRSDRSPHFVHAEIRERTSYPMSVEVRPGGELEIAFQYDRGRFTPDAVEALAERFRALLTAVLDQPDQPLAELAPAPAEGGEPAVCVHQLVEGQAARTPDAVAVICAGRELTYAELNARANRVAHWLRSRGVRAETLVAVCLARGLDEVVALLGVLKSGGAHVPLDPEHPPRGLGHQLADVAIAVGTRAVFDRLAAAGLVLPEHLLCLDDPEPPAGPDRNPVPEANATDLAYVIHTSGSTGRPKGVMVEHGALLGHVEAMCSLYGLTAADRVLHLASPAFDAALEQVLPTLAAGARLVVADGLWGPDEVLDGIDAHGVTVAELTPPHWVYLVRALERRDPAVLRGVRTFVLGGDVVPPAVLRRFLDLCPWLEVVNSYGPTEATIACAAHLVTAPWSGDVVPIGRASVPDKRVHVLDDDLRVAPVGVPGEICVSGTGLARGYLNDPERTAKRFRTWRPVPGEPPRRLYRTGDRGVLRGDGTIAFTGRVDRQVKVRGNRVEPEEVEVALLAHPDVVEAAVVPVETTDHDKELTAYLRLAPGTDVEPAVRAVRVFLAATVPSYLVPTTWVPVESIPRTPSGKADLHRLGGARAAEPAVPVTPPATGPAADTALVDHVARVWRDVLGRPRVGPHDDFFEHGGHSLLAMRAALSLSEDFDTAVPLKALFDHPTPTGMAVFIEETVAKEIAQLSDEQVAAQLGGGPRDHDRA